MANPFADAVILEGFLCPICHQDLKTPDRLTQHVEREHAEEQDTLQTLKEIFSAQSIASFAKRRLNNIRDSTLGPASDPYPGSNHHHHLQNNSSDSNYQAYSQQQTQQQALHSYVQEVGVDCDHTAQFKGIRTPRIERYATETNKLVIRLHKLLTGRPEDALKRKQHEQQLIPWVDGKLVKLCPSCARKFNLARRQHHCRLCGSVMCQDCSQYLDTDAAAHLINPTAVGEEASSGSPLPLAVANASDLDSAVIQRHLRVCEHCLHLLETRKEAQDSRNYRPALVKAYDRIQELRKDIRPDLRMYEKIINSLFKGDSVFTLQDASALRSKIGRVAERIDSLSKQILAVPAPAGSREEALKKFIRLACIAYIKEEMLALPQIPVEEELKRIQAQRRSETEKQIEMERRLVAEAMDRMELTGGGSGSSSAGAGLSKREHGDNGPNAASKGSAINSVDSWSVFQTGGDAKTKDPLVEQINIIKSYIKQARQALRFEEVEILETNLRELQQEFYNRQQQHDTSY